MKFVTSHLNRKAVAAGVTASALSILHIAHGGLVSGIDASGSTLFNFQFNNAFNLAASETSGAGYWDGTYTETVRNFQLSFRAGPNADFNNFDNDYDLYKLEIKSLWTINLEVGIRDDALTSNKDMFKFNATAFHSAGEHLNQNDIPDVGDALRGGLQTFAIPETRVSNLTAAHLTTLPRPFPLNGISGDWFVRSFILPIAHPNTPPGPNHNDSYELHFLADVNVTEDSLNGYNVIFIGNHVPENGGGGNPVPESSSMTFGACAGALILTLILKRRRR